MELQTCRHVGVCVLSPCVPRKAIAVLWSKWRSKQVTDTWRCPSWKGAVRALQPSCCDLFPTVPADTECEQIALPREN